MAKYYVKSGTLQMVVEAHDSRGAALWATHRCLMQVLPFLGEPDGPSRPSDQPPLALGEETTVNQQGFDRQDGQRWPTFELVNEWNQLLVALEKMAAYENRE